MSNISKLKRIWLRLKRGVLARQRFVDSHTSKAIAFQIREMRTRSGWSQAELAERCGTSQNAISRLESPGYGRPSISTLKKIAAAFDVGLVVRFASFGEIADWASSLTPASVLVPTFQEEDEGAIWDKPNTFAPHLNFNQAVACLDARFQRDGAAYWSVDRRPEGFWVGGTHSANVPIGEGVGPTFGDAACAAILASLGDNDDEA